MSIELEKPNIPLGDRLEFIQSELNKIRLRIADEAQHRLAEFRHDGKYTSQIGDICLDADPVADIGAGIDTGEIEEEDLRRKRYIRRIKAPLPDANLVRKMIKQREMRKKYFDASFFAEPAWDMILDLLVARLEFRKISITSLCVASGVPTTTALRWISEMVEAGVFVRTEDERDRRRAFISLSDEAVSQAAEYFAECGQMSATILRMGPCSV